MGAQVDLLPVTWMRTYRFEDGCYRIAGEVNGIKYETGWFEDLMACVNQASWLHRRYRDIGFCIDENGNIC